MCIHLHRNGSFVFSKSKIKAALILIATISVFVALILYNRISISAYKNKIEALQNDYTSVVSERDKYKNQAEDFENKYNLTETQLSQLQKRVNFYEKTVVYCTDTGKKFHTIDCYHFKQTKSFYAFNPEYARYLGYTPCSKCNPHG